MNSPHEIRWHTIQRHETENVDCLFVINLSLAIDIFAIQLFTRAEKMFIPIFLVCKAANKSNDKKLLYILTGVFSQNAICLSLSLSWYSAFDTVFFETAFTSPMCAACRKLCAEILFLRRRSHFKLYVSIEIILGKSNKYPTKTELPYSEVYFIPHAVAPSVGLASVCFVHSHLAFDVRSQFDFCVVHFSKYWTVETQAFHFNGVCALVHTLGFRHTRAHTHTHEHTYPHNAIACTPNVDVQHLVSLHISAPNYIYFYWLPTNMGPYIQYKRYMWMNGIYRAMLHNVLHAKLKHQLGDVTRYLCFCVQCVLFLG